MGVARWATRVRITVWPTVGTVSSRLRAAAAAANAGTPGTTSYGTPAASSRRICSATALKTDGSPECSRATSWPSSWARDHLGGDRVEVQLSGVDQPGAGRALGEQLARHQAARVEADPAGGERTGTAHGDQVGGAGTRADEVDGHGCSVSWGREVGDGEAACGFTADHWVTGIACRQPVKPPTGTAWATASRTSSPPCRR